MTQVTIDPGSNNLGDCRSCVHLRFPILDHTIDISKFYSIDVESIKDLVSKLAQVSDCVLTMAAAQYKKLTEEDLQVISDKGWTITVV